MCSEEYFFSEFYYPDEIVTENEGNVEVLSISRVLPIWSAIINTFITLFGWDFLSLSLEFYSKALVRGY